MKKKVSIKTVLLLEVVVFVLVFLANLIVNTGAEGLNAVGNYIDVPSILFIFLVTVPALWVTGMGKDFLRAFSVGEQPYSLRQLKRSLEAVQMVQRLIPCGAGISGLIAIVVLLSRLDDYSVLGPNLAVANLVVFYMFILEFLLLPLKAHVQNAITDLMDVEDEEA